MLDVVFWENSLRRWGIALAIIVCSLLVGRIASAILRAVAKRLQSVIWSSVANGVGVPLTTLVLVCGMRVATVSLILPAGFKTLCEKGVAFLAVVMIAWVFANAYEAIHHAVIEPYARQSAGAVDIHLFGLMRTLIGILIWAVGLASAFHTVGFEVSAILASFGIGGMAIALASQDTVANIFGGLLIMTQRPFKIGERIDVAGINGWVQHLGLRNTVIKNWYGREVLVPNKKFTDSPVVNIDSQQVYLLEARLRLDMQTSAPQVDSAIQILRDIVRENPLLDKSPWVMFDKIEYGFFEIEFWYGVLRWNPKETADIPNEYEKVCRAKTQVNLAILSRFEAAGIRLALPIRASGVPRDSAPRESPALPAPPGGAPAGPR